MFRCISTISTSRYIWLACGLAILSVMLSQLGKLIPYGANLATNVVEWVVMGMFLLSYLMSWVLLVVGPLRPYSTFTRQGDISRRVSNFLSALGALVMLHIFLAFQIGTSGS